MAAALNLTIDQVDQVDLYAVDIDPAAAACARRTLPGAHVYAGDLYEPLPTTLRRRVDVIVDVIVANAPYVPSDEVGLLPVEARDHEARVSLDGGVDGRDILRRVIAAVVAAAGLTPRVARSDELRATVVVGTRRGRH